MRVIKDIENIKPEDKFIAQRMVNQLKAGKRVFGNPGEGLHQTLKKLEKDLEALSANRDKLQYLDVGDDEILHQQKLIKAGIVGEEELASFLELVVKHDDILEDFVFFASLADPDQQVSADYISDSDFIGVYGNNILIIDAKNLNTNPEIPLYLEGRTLTAMGSELIDIHSATYIWEKIFIKHNVLYEKISGCVCIVNKKGAVIFKNKDWHALDTKVIHISGLVEFLKDWIKDKSPEINLSLLTTIAKMQIKKETTGLDLRNTMKRLGI